MNASKAEFWLCLAHAFLTPATASAQQALRIALADDLEELAATLGYPIGPELADYRQAIAAVPADEGLLVLYSKLFLVPGTAHPHINAAVYLDGTVHGGTLRQLTECYRACGLDKRDSFADLPDHVATQLEFTAWLFAAAAARDAGERAPTHPFTAAAFIERFIARWTPLFREDLERAGVRFALASNPWLHLARILEKAARHEVGVGTAAAAQEDEVARLRAQYAGRQPDVSDLARIRASLEQAGLSSAHVEIPLAERDAANGLTPLPTPEPARHIVRTA